MSSMCLCFVKKRKLEYIVHKNKWLYRFQDDFGPKKEGCPHWTSLLLSKLVAGPDSVAPLVVTHR